MSESKRFFRISTIWETLAASASQGRAFPPALLFVLVLIVFGNSLLNGFVWDDENFLVGNHLIKNFELGKILTTPVNGLEYLPIRDLTIALDYLVWGERPFGFHLTNLLLYCLNVLAVYYLALELSFLLSRDDEDRNAPAASLAALATALLFAVHPIHSEVVAFIGGRGNLLSGFFFLAAYLYLIYLRKEPGARGRFYFGALACFTFALLSKATVIILPLALALFIVFSRKKDKPREMLFLSPFFLLAGAAYALYRSVAVQANVIDIHVTGGSLAAKAAVALQIPFFYLGKLFLPRGFSAEYGVAFSESLLEPLVLSAMAGYTVLFGAAVLVRRRFPQALPGLFLFLLTLIPVLHFFATHPVVADRYAYLPSFAVFYLMATAWALVRGARRKAVLAAGIALVLAWSVVSFGQNRAWRSSESLWAHAVKVDPTAEAYIQLAAAYVRGPSKDLEKAISISAKAFELDPTSHYCFYYRGISEYEKGNYPGALELFNRALGVAGDEIAVLYSRGLVYEKEGNTEKALDSYEKAFLSRQMDPNNALRTLAGRSLRRLQEVMSSRLDFMRGKVREKPDDLNALGELAFTLDRGAFYDEALARYGELEKRGAVNWQLFYNMAHVHAKMRNDQEAVRYYEKSLAINPMNVDTLNNLGLLYRKSGDFDGARKAFEKAMAMDAHFAFAPFNLAVTYFMMRDEKNATRYFTYTRQTFPALAAGVSQYVKVMPKQGEK